MLSVQQFLTKNSMTPMPHPPYLPNLTLSNFFFVSPDEKSSQREIFCQCGRSETKKGRSTKRHQNYEFKTVLSSGKNILIDVFNQMGSTLKVIEV